MVVLMPPNIIDHCMQLQIWATRVFWNNATSVFSSWSCFTNNFVIDNVRAKYHSVRPIYSQTFQAYEKVILGAFHSMLVVKFSLTSFEVEI